MPSFDFHCAANGETHEVFLRMGETLKTWGELCAKLGRETGDTPADAPIEKIFTSAWVIDKDRLGSGAKPLDFSFTGKSTFE
jgi:hypothetical protein